MKIMVIATSTALLATACVTTVQPYRGHLSIWPEVEVFTLCGSNEPLWLDYDMQTREPIAKEHWVLQQTPYGNTFAVIEGQVGPQLDCAFCDEYKGSFKVHRVQEQRAPSPSDCAP